jgi:hypothetical protein
MGRHIRHTDPQVPANWTPVDEVMVWLVTWCSPNSDLLFTLPQLTRSWGQMLKNVGPKVYICSEGSNLLLSNLLLQRLSNGTIRTINKVSMFYLFIRLYLCLSIYFLLITLSVGRHSTLTTALYIFLFVYQTLSGGLSFSLALWSQDYLFFCLPVFLS